MTRLAIALLFVAPLTTSAADPVRLVVPLDGGPLLVDLYLSLDGRPYQKGREELAEEMLALADEDGDGVPTWGEAVLNPRFPFNLGRQRQLARQFDRDKDTVMSRDEALALLERYGGGPALNVVARGSAASTKTIGAIFDTDGDGLFSTEELDAAAARLRMRDANDDDLLDAAEVLGAPVGVYTPFRRVLQRPNGPTTAAGTSFVMDAENGTNVARQVLVKRYGKNGRIPKAAWTTHGELFERLDADGDEFLRDDEFAGLRTAPAHVTADVNVGRADAGPVGVRVDGLARPVDREGVELGERSTTTRLTRAGTGVVLQTAPDRARPNYAQTAANVLRTADTDENGYLEIEELEKNRAQQYFVQQFDSFDVDMDGKIYAEEIEAFYERQQAPRNTQVVLVVSELQPTLFDGLDVDGDRRLSVRELRGLPRRFAELDVNGDGRIGPDELPGETTITLGRFGSNVYGVQTRYFANPGQPSVGELQSKGPKWFAAMDVNGDGDLTPREFVGTAEQFAALDTNEDGFVDAAEAEAASRVDDPR